MKSQEILSRYLSFYKKNEHAETPNVSLVPEGDSTLLFVNSGMFPLVPYLSGEPHPLGKRLVNVQRSMRFEDLEEIGDYNHTTCFHMIGNWSLGDYFKKEQLPWVYEFFVEEVGLDPNKLYATVFAGDDDAPRDDESIALLQEIFAKYGVEAEIGKRIFTYGKKDNWWQRGDAVGELGGPDSEIFYYLGEGTPEGKNPADHDSDFLEIGNSVFMQFVKTEDGWSELPQKNVDFGGGFERIAMVSQGKTDIFETDNFWPLIERVQTLSGKNYHDNEENKVAMRVLVDHIRAATFLAMDGVYPSNKDQGYALRRFIRRMVRYARKLEITDNVSAPLVSTVGETFEWLYPQIKEQQSEIEKIFTEEEEKFSNTIAKATREVNKRLENFDADVDDLALIAFDLYQSLGYPPEMLLEDAQERGIAIESEKYMEAYERCVAKHKQDSRKGAEQKFKGGLADNSEDVVRYHTATHLLNYALREVLGDHVEQRGSNITGERLRFDFSHDQKLSEEELESVEKLINEKVAASVSVGFEMMEKDKALETGAIHAFNEKYGEQVKVYYIGESLEDAFSKEFCGGPHVENTSEIGQLQLYKQESVGKGVRRIYAKSYQP